MSPGPGPQCLSDVLSELISLRGFARTRGSAELAELWREVVGKQLAAETRVVGVNRGVLQVAVSSSPLLSELASFQKPALLQAVRDRYPEGQIRDIRFRLNSALGKV